MIVDGRALAATLYDHLRTEVASRPRPPKLAIVTCAPGVATQQYLELKRRKALAVGISLTIIELPESSTTEETIATVTTAAAIADGVVVQLPLPAHINREAVLSVIPTKQDPDGFSYENQDTAILPPVVAAIDIISKYHNIDWADKEVAIVGHGRLVGQPVAVYAEKRGARVNLIVEKTTNREAILATADILVSGVGVPHFIVATELKEGVIVFDAGASEDGGVVVGDVQPQVAEKANLFTPVPGGIGPLTVAALFSNLVTLTR